MLLVVGTDHVRADHLASLERDHAVAITSSIDDARSRRRSEPFDAVIVDRDLSDTEVAWFVWDLRNGDVPPVPVVAIGSSPSAGPAVDERVTAPVDPDELRGAVERAIKVDEYDAAVRHLFTACRHGIGRRSRELGSARQRADECLRALDSGDGRLPIERLIDA